MGGEKKIHLDVYGAEIKCPSCVNAPGAKETYEWLQAAISRKYGNQDITYHYIDIHKSENEEKHTEFVNQILNDELFYPLVVVEGEIVAEGIPRLKTVYQALEQHGLQELTGL
ncbi:YuzD family protein [Halobacillus rhizosphaerae]|uniref:YuzD family protein n=1 Tax=Halobacillus rhizosphaerae TaxID=3064889 RepID=UPI00398B310B